VNGLLLVEGRSFDGGPAFTIRGSGSNYKGAASSPSFNKPQKRGTSPAAERCASEKREGKSASCRRRPMTFIAVPALGGTGQTRGGQQSPALREKTLGKRESLTLQTDENKISEKPRGKV